MAIIARPRPVFCVFGPKIPRTFYFKLTEQSSRKKLAVGGFEPEKVRLLYPAPRKKPDDEIVKLQGEVLALHKLHQRGSVKGEEYEERIADYHSRIDQLEEKRKALQTTETQFNKIKLWIDNFRDMVEAEAGTENPDTMIRSLTEQIIIYETYVEIRLKCGVSIKQEYIRKRRNFTKQK